MLIGFDIDGVLFPWADAANDSVVWKFGIPDPGPHTTWLHLKNTITGGQWKWLWSTEGQDDVFSQVWRNYSDAVAVVNALLGEGHKIHFVTHRDPRRTCGHTADFLTKHFGRFPWAGVHIVQNSVEKRKLCRWDAFVDDKPETVFDFLAHTSIPVFVPVRPWNSELESCRQLVCYDDPTVILEWAEGAK